MERIEAAGAVVLRKDSSGGHEVLVIHREKYDDWSLPKGKLKPGESWVGAAVREVEEETGARVRLNLPLDSVRFKVKGKPKLVRWWRAELLGETERPPDDEVDQQAWIPVAEAAERLSYADEAALVEQAVTAPATVPLIITRHAKAMLRKHWAGLDSARPLTRRGRVQAAELNDIFAAFGVNHLVSSSSNRCVSTVLPYATREFLTIDRQTILSEERGVPHPGQVESHIRKLRQVVIAEKTPTVVCGHRPVLPSILSAMDLPNRFFRTAESVVINLSAEDEVISAEWIRTII